MSLAGLLPVMMVTYTLLCIQHDKVAKLQQHQQKALMKYLPFVECLIFPGTSAPTKKPSFLISIIWFVITDVRVLRSSILSVS